MNINFTAAVSSKKKEPKKTIRSNVFGDDDDDDEYDEPSSRAGVNEAVRSEQDALKVRSQKAIQAADTSVYDYDGAYDSFHRAQTDEKEKEEDRRSRYIEDLLEAAKKRKHEKDIIYEKKIAREQAMEEAEEDYRGKEKFVTAAYRKKLEERKLWLAQDERQRQEEEANDVTKRTGGLGMASFYGNLSNNVALGGSVEDEGSKIVPEIVQETTETESEKSGGRNDNGEPTSEFSNVMEQYTEPSVDDDAHAYKVSSDKENKKRSVREMRDQKVKEALERYRKRHNLPV